MRRACAISAAMLTIAPILLVGCHDSTGPGGGGGGGGNQGSGLASRPLAAAANLTCALKNNGATFCWGLDFGYNAEPHGPTAVAGGYHFIQISEGLHHICALGVDSLAYCWGSNQIGQLGDAKASGDTVVQSPVRVAGDHRFVRISVGQEHTCGIDLSGVAFCWGWNEFGQLGDSVPNYGQSSPVQVAGGHVFSDIAAGGNHTCALDDGGAAWCWGYNDHGQLGVTGASQSRVPIAVGGEHIFAHLTAGASWACGIDESGAAFCWGNDDHGQLGDGALALSASPVAVSGGHRFVEITAGSDQTCGLESGGSAFCWGGNDRGELGDGSLEGRTTPVAVSGGHSFAHLQAGPQYACGKTGGGAVYCWGSNTSAHLGSHVAYAYYETPTKVAGGHRFTGLAAGGAHVCGSTSGGPTICWGSDLYGQSGLDSTLWRRQDIVPTEVTGGRTFVSVSAGTAHTCALDASGAAFCWGRNAAGELGVGSSDRYFGFHATPGAVLGGHSFTQVSAGSQHTCALDGGAAFCWGNDKYGQLGDGTDGAVSESPVAVGGGHTFTAIAAGGAHTCALDAAGAAFCWGSNASSALGTGDSGTGAVDSPVAVAGGHTFTRISADSSRTCGLDAGGAAWCWGFIRLYDGQTPGSTTPEAVPGGHKFTRIAVGVYHTCGVDTNGAAWCWGQNQTGALGDGTRTWTTTPVQVAGGHTFVDVVAGSTYTCGVTGSGDAYCWGDNTLGQVGVEYYTRSPIPLQTDPLG